MSGFILINLILSEKEFFLKKAIESLPMKYLFSFSKNCRDFIYNEIFFVNSNSCSYMFLKFSSYTVVCELGTILTLAVREKTHIRLYIINPKCSLF